MAGWRRRRQTPEQAFSDEVAQLVPQLVATQRVDQHDDFSLHITMAGGEVVVMFLQNIFAEASKLEGDPRAERIRRAVLAMNPPARPVTWAEAAPKVLPAVRAASTAAAYTAGSIVPIRSVLVPLVFRLLALDEEHSLSFVTEEDVTAWAVEAAAVEARAGDNLRHGGAEVAMNPRRRVDRGARARRLRLVLADHAGRARPDRRSAR